MANEEEDYFYMDVQEYANSYTGRNQILRLVHLADHCVGDMFYGDLMELDALRLAHDLLRWGELVCDIRLYRKVVTKIRGRLGPKYLLDTEFTTMYTCEHLISDYIRHLHRAQTPYKWYQYANLIDQTLYHSGSITEFMPFRLRFQLIEASMSTILVALETKEYNEARYRTMLQIASYHQNDFYRYKLECASSLADLGERKYKNAAEGFLKLVKDVKEYDYSEVLSSEDVITYGLVCAMATFDRDKLKEALREVIEPLGVVDHLKEIIKPFSVVFYLTDIIEHFLNERFTTCIKLLDKQRPRLLLDIYLFEHVDFLLSEIKDVMVAGYLQSFSFVMLENYTIGLVDSQNGVSRVILDSGGLVVPESQVIRLVEASKVQGRIYADQATGRSFFKSE